MGRFDILTQLEEKQPSARADTPVPPSSERSPAPAIQETHEQAPTTPLGDTTSPTQPASGKKQRASGKNPAPQQPGKSINALQPKLDKFEKYSTYLRPGYKKILKNIANDRDCKAYEVLDEVLTAFFETRKK
jgi:hypothetical protein